MRAGNNQKSSWLRRLARQFGLDRNPLRRRIDRAQAALLFVLIAAFVAAAPVLTAVAGHWARNAGISEQRAERGWRQVTATLLVPGPATGRNRTFPAAPMMVRATAQWRAPDGQLRTGLVPVIPGVRAGSTVPVWVNAAGFPGRQPLRTAQREQKAALAELVTICALAVAACLIADTGRKMFDRRRLASWDKEWRAIGPLWSRQRW